MSVEQWVKKIQGYLADNQTQAFISRDLGTRVRGRVTGGLAGLSESDFKKALKTLVGSGSVKTKVINGLKYYSHRPR